MAMKERSTVDYGIDLGLHQSAIARIENGIAVIKKNDIQSDTTPSAVAFESKGRIRVGQQVYNQLKVDRLGSQRSGDYKRNVFVEFKRTMGTDEKYSPAIQPESVWTSEQLSAEVLKKLLECVPDERVHAAVIAVPSEFKIAQQQATLKAAELAGLNKIFLVKEPVAALLALGNGIAEGEQFLIFNLGDSCFSVDFVMIGDGIMSVMDFEGDYFLGGKDLDLALVDLVIIPAVQQDYDIDHILSDSNKKENFRMAMMKWAEEIKIKLSYSATHAVISEMGEIFLEDANGEEIELDFVVTREQMVEAVRPIFQRAIDKSLALLARHGLEGEDLDELILVGGPTLSPILREMLSNQMKAPNTSVDPRTCVARGAALYGSTIRLVDAPMNGLVEEIPFGSAGGAALDLNFHSHSLTEFEFVSIQVKSGNCEGATVELSSSDWSSGKYPIGRRGAVIEVPLTTNSVNVFEVLLRRETGGIMDCFPRMVSIIQGNGLAEEQPEEFGSLENRPALGGGVVSLELCYARMSEGTLEFVTVRSKDDRINGASIELERAGWSSGKYLIGVNGALMEVNLGLGRENIFSVILRDAFGNRMPCQPASISITQRAGGKRAPLPNSLGIGIRHEGIEIFETLQGAEQGVELPVIGVFKSLRTLQDVRPGVLADSFSIRLYEGGADAQGTPALANDFVCELMMTGKDVDQMIPSGSHADLTVETGPDSSLPVKVTLFFPALDEEIELAMPSIIKGPTAQDLFYRIFYDCDRVVSRMREDGDVDLARLSELEDRLDDVKDHFDAASGDRVVLDQTLHRLRELYRKVWHLSR